MSLININESASIILDRLMDNGHKAYVVGGCVRDSLLGIKPKDWDICTSATPSDIHRIFKDYTIYDTGLKHGTVTIAICGEMFEVTTFRRDGKYSDGRHPDTVEFSCSLKDDLARRDFTINAMAYNYKEGLTSYGYGGLIDFNKRLIRCVGNSKDRFTEDALRILRAMRFSSVYNFEIADETKESMISCSDWLHKVSMERVCSELSKLIIGERAGRVIFENIGIIGKLIPELLQLKGFKQNNKYHCYDVLEHTTHVVDNIEQDLVLRLSALFHDIAKPLCYSEDENGIGHFYRHGAAGKEITREIMQRLRFSNDIIEEVSTLVKYHDCTIENKSRSIKRWLNKVGEEAFRNLLKLRKADILAQAKRAGDTRLDEVAQIEEKMQVILANSECFSLKDLNINGRDIIELGVSEGKQVGDTLNLLLNLVIDGNIENTKECLSERVKILVED